MPRIKSKKTEYLVKDFSHWLEDKARDKKMTQKEVAFLLGMSQQSFSYKLRNNSFTYEDFIKLMEIFKPSEKELIGLIKSWE